MDGDERFEIPRDAQARMSGAVSGPDPDDGARTLHDVAARTSTDLLALRYRTEQELHEAKAQLEERSAALSMSVSLLNATLESAPDGIVAYDLSGRIMAHNSRFSASWGVPPNSRSITERRSPFRSPTLPTRSGYGEPWRTVRFDRRHRSHAALAGCTGAGRNARGAA